MSNCKNCDDNLWSAEMWELCAIKKSWLPWWTGWQRWPLVWLGGDEFNRRTLVVGPVVFPLWRCRCVDCTERLDNLERRVEAG